jgi:hypothetical protein
MDMEKEAEMKPKSKTWGMMALAPVLALVASGMAMANDPYVFPLTTTVGVEPELYDLWTSGDAGQECVVNLGYDFGLKVDNDAVNDTYSGACDAKGSCELADEFNNTITITNSDGVFFDWAATPFKLGAVVVKGGTGANVFEYDPTESMDTGLYAPLKTEGADAGKPRDISHVSFCWNKGEEGDECYQDETAWAVGTPYVNKGNWAMYVPYTGTNITVDLRADGGDGVGMLAGTATFSAPVNGFVTITINLTNGFIFYYDLNNDLEDNNLKVQDYAKAPKGNPSPGKFKWKTMIPVGSTTGSIIVPQNNFYGVHLDLAYEAPCE